MSSDRIAFGMALACIVSCSKETKPMDWHALLPAVHNDVIQFGSMRPPDSEFVTIGRQVFVTAPPEAVRLSQTGDPAVLDALVPILRERERAFAAAVVLSTMTRHEADLVEPWTGRPNEWWDVLGKGAFERWDTWLRERRGKLVWEPTEKCFREAK